MEFLAKVQKQRKLLIIVQKTTHSPHCCLHTCWRIVKLCHYGKYFISNRQTEKLNKQTFAHSLASVF